MSKRVYDIENDVDIPPELQCGAVNPHTGQGPCIIHQDHVIVDHLTADEEDFTVPPEDGLSARRTYFATLEDALRAFGMKDGALIRRVQDELASLPVPQWDCWMPQSGSYVAVGKARGVDGQTASGTVSRYIHMNRIMLGNGDPLCRLDERSTRAVPETCPDCFTTLPASGVCDCRDD